MIEKVDIQELKIHLDDDFYCFMYAVYIYKDNDYITFGVYPRKDMAESIGDLLLKGVLKAG